MLKGREPDQRKCPYGRSVWSCEPGKAGGTPTGGRAGVTKESVRTDVPFGHANPARRAEPRLTGRVGVTKESVRTDVPFGHANPARRAEPRLTGRVGVTKESVR